MSTNQSAVTDGFNSTSQTITYDASQRLRISSRWAAGGYSVGVPLTLSTVLLYSKMLAANEVLQNFTAARERFKI